MFEKQRVFYVDPQNGRREWEGLSEDRPVSDYRALTLQPGDTVLFRRGSRYRGALRMTNGSPEGVITYGAYGEGPNPRFYGSASACGADCWEQVEENLWQYCGPAIPEVGNIVLNGGEACGTMCWETDELSKQGDWYDSLAGAAENLDGWKQEQEGKERRFLFYSRENPGVCYRELECCLVKDRTLLQGNRYVTVEDLCFLCNGVHGFGETRPSHVTVRRCEFRFLGGAVWKRSQKIRFGNGFELWQGGEDILVQNNRFYEIYDSCVTHQGDEACQPVERVRFLGNIFEKYGMAAYEVRDLVGREVCFHNNVCLGAGEGFALQNETPPRRSEIWPQPMGHHLFLWRIDRPTEGGCISVKGNVFGHAPLGAAVYSIVSPEAQAQIPLDGNFYSQIPGGLLIHMAGVSYSEAQFDSYRRDTGMDRHSLQIQPETGWK